MSDNNNIFQNISNSSNVGYSLHNHNNINDNERNFSCSYYRFSISYSMAFFFEERRKHYRNMKNEIFKPLSQLNLNKKPSYSQSLFDYARYSIHDVKTSLFYKYALEHLTKDRPNFNLDLKLSNFKESLENHNEEVESLEKEIPLIIQKKFRISYQTLTGRQYSFIESSINYILKNRFERFYTTSKSDKIVEEINTYSTKETYKNITYQNGIIKFDGLRIAENNNLTENDIEQYIEIMDKLIKDDFISNKLKKFKQSNENLDLQINEIKQEITPIVETIDRELYETKAKCCPTVLRLIRNYFF